MPAIQQTQEVLTIRGKVQLPSLDTVTANETETAAWNDSGISVATYYMWATTDCHILHKLAAGGTAAGPTTGVLLLADNPVSIRINLGDVIAARAVADAGTVKFMRLNDCDGF